MDRLSPIIFGDFTKEERLVYFNLEAVQSSGIEFPEEFYLHTAYNKQDYSQIELGGLSTVEHLSKHVAVDTGHELLTNLCRETDTSNEYVPNSNETQSGPINDENEVKCTGSRDNARVSVTSNVSPGVQEKNSCKEGEISHEDLPDKNSVLVDNIENGMAPQQVTSTPQDRPTNVVTVGTKTMLTTSTRTVESSKTFEGTKSSWADLFKTKPSSKPQGPLTQNKPHEAQQQDQSIEEDELVKKDQFQQYFLDVLKKTTLTNQVPSLQPRGLKNNGNWCYINSTLQVLLFCPSFYHFLMKFKLKTERGTSFTPILDALVMFASQFNEMPPQQSTGKSREWNRTQDVVMGIPFEPTYVYRLLNQVKTTLSQQGKQEDAEEFLSCILNGLHDEFVQLVTQNDKTQDVANNVAVGEQAVGDWEQVGPRNKSTVTRKAATTTSPVVTMFGGLLRSSLVQPGVKESASIQPFFNIPLDLRGDVSTVQQAFDNFFRVEEVEGFQCDKSKTEVEVSKKSTLDSLPIVLVLHLKRFVVSKNGSCEKLTRKISYDSLLQVPIETLSKGTKVKSRNMLTYKLFAVTYHHGKNLHGGHYTSDIAHPSVGWLRADDMSIRTVPAKFVFNPLSNRDPYLLYYCRGDILN